MKRWIILSVCAVVILFFGVNHSWSHAALVRLMLPAHCDSYLVENAKDAVGDFFGGEMAASPDFLCLQGSALGLAVSHGSARFAPLMPTIIVLGPEGQNPDVAAHEGAHAELAERTSVLLRTYRLPTWFDEGLAMQLDGREAYLAQALSGYLADPEVEPPSLAALDTPSAFFRPGLQGRLHYAFAKCVVGEWLRGSERDALKLLIANTGWRRAFPIEHFRKYEGGCQDELP